MSFGLTLKEELCQIPLKNPCCNKSEALGILLYCSAFSPQQIKITTSSLAFATRLPLLFQEVFQLSFDHLPTPSGKFIFSIETPEKLNKIFDLLLFDPTSISLHIPFPLVEEPCCATSFFRGAFLAGGSITDPNKSYHLELVTSHASVNRELPALLHEYNFSAKSSQRKGHFITYFKQSTQIQSFLTTIGAPNAASQVQNSSTHKNLTSSVNRQVNCDAANLNKAVDAAQSQIKAIRSLETQGLLEDLPEKLQETARLRLENAHCTLSELAEYFTPPITKSALNHRLRKLISLANNLPVKEDKL